MMPNQVMVDTDVLVDYLRNYPLAVDYLEGLVTIPYVSVLTVAELFTGVKEGKERKSLETLLETLQVVPLDDETAKLGGLWLRDYSKSHGVGLADALIAATAKLQGCTLVTLNTKHFPMLTAILSPYQKGKRT